MSCGFKSSAREGLEEEREIDRETSVRPYPRPGDVDDSGAWQDKGRGVWSGRLDLTLVDFGRYGSSFGGWVGL